ncbi:hypothetical protein ONZ45_g11155 [Pleurotus djamor]|nr:hypothetical protein ONZ45_g11155 [Pleurotus djamor]
MDTEWLERDGHPLMDPTTECSYLPFISQDAHMPDEDGFGLDIDNVEGNPSFGNDNPISKSEAITCPPTPRRRCIPLPSQVDEEWTLHPVLTLGRSSTIRLDFLSRDFAPRSRSSYSTTLATDPALQSLTIFIANDEDPIIVHGSTSGVTILDVFTALRQWFTEKIGLGDDPWSFIGLLKSNQHPDAAVAYFAFNSSGLLP